MERIRIVLGGMTAVQSSLLRTLLESREDVEIVATETLDRTLSAVHAHLANLVLLPVPASDGFDLCQSLEREAPGVKVLLLNRTPAPTAVDLYELRRLAVDASREQLLSAIDELIAERRTERLNPHGS